MPQITLTEAQWEERFKPLPWPNGDGCRQFNFPEDAAEIEQALAERRLWTGVENDAGDDICYAQGFHIVNREYYVICEVPYGEDEDIEVLSDYQPMRCTVCLQAMIIGPHELEASEGVSHHVTLGEHEIDHELDADHVALAPEA